MSDTKQTNTIVAVAEGSVLPAGALRPAGQPITGRYDVVIEEVQEHGKNTMVRCRYPDGFIKHHMADSVEALLPQVTRQIKARHGIEEVKNISVPSEIDAGVTITQEVVVHE